MAGQQQIAAKVRDGRLGLALGLIATPILYWVGGLLGGDALGWRVWAALGVLGVGLSLMISEKQRRPGKGIVVGFAAWALIFAGVLIWFYTFADLE